MQCQVLITDKSQKLNIQGTRPQANGWKENFSVIAKELNYKPHHRGLPSWPPAEKKEENGI